MVASVVDPHEIGIASSILALVRNISGAVGIALFGTILSNRIGSNVFTIQSFSTLHSANPVVVETYTALIGLKAQIDAYNYVFFIAAVLVFLGAFTSLLIKVEKERTDIHVMVE